MKKQLLFLFLCVCGMHVGAQQMPQDYTLKLLKNTLKVTNGKASFGFTGDFTVFYTMTDPKMELRNITDCKYFAPSWQAKNLPADKIIGEIKKNQAMGGDGIDDAMTRSGADRTFDLFYAAPAVMFTPSAVAMDGDTVRFTYKKQEVGELSCIVYRVKNQAPVLKYEFRPAKEGWFSVAYTGAPSFPVEQLDALWQPMVWQRKIFPKQSYMTLAFTCPVPTCLVSVKGNTAGVVASSEELPFQPLPTRDNNRFGVALRDREGNARPMLLAPVLGHLNSKMHQGDCFTFRLHLLAENSSIASSYETIARNLFDFKDYRSNAISSLNNAIDNIIDYTLSPYSNFIDSLKGCSYSTDVPGSVKNVSSLNPLEVALISDDAEVYDKRAYPIMEFMLSREKTLFCLDTTQKVQSPSRKMGGPCATISELALLYKISAGNCGILKTLAEDKFYKGKPQEKRVKGAGGNWYDALEMYRATGEKEYLDYAVKGADVYIATHIEKEPEKFQNAFFWTSYAPKYINLLEMYEETGNRKYLDAARMGAREYAMFVWMAPRIPDENILVNKGGLAPYYWYLKSKGMPQQKAPEETVPAWRLSETGLVPESSTTCIGHRAVFMAHHAPYMLRIAGYTGDQFLYDIARSAVVGRYANFPGYHINTERTTAYEKADFPLRWHNEMSVNSFHYNHPFPMLSVLYDYIISDAMDKSKREVEFKGDYIEGYGYLQAKFYGMHPGKFYDYNDAWLWMPRRLLTSTSVELNYISARTDNRLLLAFTNQSAEQVSAVVTFNLELIPELAGKEFITEVWIDNRKTAETVVKNGELNIEVSPRGITAIAIKDIHVTPRFQNRILGRENTVWKHDYLHTSFGNADVMILNMAHDLKTAYIYLRDNDTVFENVTLAYKTDDGRFQAVTDHSFPFEFTIPLKPDTQDLYINLTGIEKEGQIKKSETFKLSAK